MSDTKKIEVQVLNAFVDNDQGGNPAGVVLNADNLSNENKLEIASRVGLSETAFVSKSNRADFKLDFFTPNKQIAHCGHATIATFSYLKQLGIVKSNHSSKETIDGVLEILLKEDYAYMEQKAPRYIDVSHKKKDILIALGLDKNDLISNKPIQVVNTGNSFMLIPVKNSTILKNIEPNHDIITSISNEFDLIGFYPFTLDTKHKDRDGSSRMFGPRYNIFEEAATGMAAGPLACYLYDQFKSQKKKFLIEQGEYMKNPSSSLITVDLTVKNGRITSLMAGGKGMFKKRINIEINS